jgi:hypothetical protein
VHWTDFSVVQYTKIGPVHWTDLSVFIHLYGYTIVSVQYDKINPIKSVHKNKLSLGSGGRALSTFVSTIFFRGWEPTSETIPRLEPTSENITRLETNLGKYYEAGNRCWKPTSEDITMLETDLRENRRLGAVYFRANDA